MNRRILTFYYIISIFFFLFILIFAGYRLKITIDANSNESKKTLESLRISALSVYLAEGGFDTPYFQNTMRREFRASERLALLAIYSRSRGFLYLIARDERYLLEPPSREGDSAWKGKPEYTLRPVYESKLTLPFSPGQGTDLHIDGIFQELRKVEVYPILREIFYILLVYLFITSVFLLAAATSGAPSARVNIQKSSRAVQGSARNASRGVRRPSPMMHESGQDEKTVAGLYSPRTGLGWKQHLVARLGSELERAAASDQDLALLLVEADFADAQNEKLLGDYTLKAFPLRDLAFEYDSNTVAVILPEKDLDEALRDAYRFRSQLRAASWSGTTAFYMGVSARNGRLVSPNRVLTEAEHSLKQSESAGANQIVAFRADPEKYRQQIISAAKKKM